MVSSNEPTEGPNPFGDLAKLLQSLGLGGAGMPLGAGMPGLPGMGGAGSGSPWDQAKQIATSVASGGNEANVDPLARMALEDLARVAELHVRQAPGVSLDAATTVRPVSRTEWAKESVDAYRPFFERFGEAMGNAVTAEQQALTQDGFGDDPMAAMLGQMFSSLGPMMVAASAGSMLGHLGLRALGQYDLPIPRPGDNVLVIPGAIDEAAEAWDVSLDEVRLAVLVHELCAHAVLNTPHVRSQLENLLIDFAAGFRPNADLIEQEFGSLFSGGMGDLSQLGELANKMNDPEMMLGLMRSGAQDLLVPQMSALVAAILGYVDVIVERICSPLIPAYDRIRSGMRERIINVTPADRFMERLLGLEVTIDTVDRGRSFIEGVSERAGDDGLVRLWADELDLPTAAEIAAPGLWLARIGLDADIDTPTFEIPDDLSGLEDL